MRRRVLHLAVLGLALLLATLARAQQDQLVYLPLVIRASAPNTVPTPGATVSPVVTATISPTATYTLTPSPTASLVIAGVSPSGPDEVVEVRNTGSDSQSMAGWTLQSWDGTVSPCAPQPDQVFSFPSDFTLDAGASVRIHSGSAGGARPRTATDLPWTTRNVWNDQGDRGDLRTPSGQVVSSYDYGRCR